MFFVLFLVTIFAGIAGGKWLLHSTWFRSRRRERHVDLCLVLLYLIQDIQRHRGLSGALLDGHKEFRAEREATELRLQRSLGAVVEQFGERHPLFHTAPWRVMLGHWEALHNNWQSLDFFSGMIAHSNVVGEMVEIVRSLAEEHRLQLGESRVRALGEWPAVIEQLGMLRALGLHALSENATVDAEQLDQLVARYLRLARKSLQSAALEDASPSLIARTRRALDRVEWLLDGNSARYHPYTFYEELTGVIDDWYSKTREYLRGPEPAARPTHPRKRNNEVIGVS